MYFYTIFPIPFPFPGIHHCITLFIYSYKRVFFLVTHPDARFTPPNLPLSIFIGGGENLLRAPNGLAHAMKKIKIEVVED